MKLNVKALALTTGIIWSLGIFIFTWWVIMFEGPNYDPNILTHLYRGYSITPVGSLIGLIYGFADGIIGGMCIAWVYNMFLPREEKE